MHAAITRAIATALNAYNLTDTSFSVEHPADLTHGDYASNVALVTAKRLGKPPREVAEELRIALAGVLPEVERIEVAGPGFLNFFLHREYFSARVADIIAAPEGWGSHDAWAGKTVLVEYTSPNLFKPLHVGNLVGNIIGESITRLFEYSGALVKRINYPSDIGLTVAKAVWGLAQTAGNPHDINALGEAYRYGNEAYENDESKKAEIEAVNQALYANSDEKLNVLRDSGIVTSKYRLNTICASLGTRFDTEILESIAAPVGVQVVRSHSPGVFEESDGAIVYKGEKVGLHTRVFLNSKGLPTYEAKDLGNFSIKQDRFPDWNHSIIVTGNEQAEYFKVLYAAICEVYPKVKKQSLEHIATGFLTLTTGKMSSRKGNVLSGEQVLQELEEAAVQRGSSREKIRDDETPLATKIATAAIKYQILRMSVGSNIVFDKEKALSFEGDSGPYLQYTYARIQSVLAKAANSGVRASTSSAPAQPYELEKLLYRFPEVTAAALRERAPHLVTTYLTQLAGAYNSFYGTEKIADPTDPHAPYKAAVSHAVGVTLKNGLWALGIEAPERM